MAATVTQSGIEALAISRAVAKGVLFSDVAVTPDSIVTASTATGGTVTAEPGRDYGWVVTVRDAGGAPTPMAGIQSTYAYDSHHLAAHAMTLALLADQERAVRRAAA